MHTYTDYLYTATQIRQLEQLAITDGITVDTLMQKAGAAAFALIKQHWPDLASMIVFCGCGNNGGDGYIVAKLAHEQGITVQVNYIGNLNKLTGAALHAMQACKKAGIKITPFDITKKSDAELYVDALLGIGLQGKVKENIATAIDYINSNATNIVAIDVPSGICADTGTTMGTAILADYTITFIGVKQGLLTGDAPDYCGDIICDDLELPAEYFTKIKHNAEIISIDNYENWFIPRNRTANKGNFGHVLIIGGNYGMPGAPRMAAQGAARVGAGMVTIATINEHATLLNIAQPELMCRGITNAADLTPLLEKASVIAIGPGLAQTAWSTAMLQTVLKTTLPLIIDADALNLLVSLTNPITRNNWILTPHPGEAARLLNTDTKTIQQNRFSAITAITKKYDGICVLKGAGSIVLDQTNVAKICSAGNPGMASGGMGDILTGIIAGLVAQGMPLAAAAECGVCLHAEAADWAAAESGERGLLATDLLPYLRELVN
jgi:NAD(P)H-hydrate epimerase